MEITKQITCRGCPAEIKFIQNEDERWVPIDVDPISIVEDKEGKVIGYRSDGVRIRGREFPVVTSANAHLVFWIYRSHYQTCLNPDKFSGKRKGK